MKKFDYVIQGKNYKIIHTHNNISFNCFEKTKKKKKIIYFSSNQLNKMAIGQFLKYKKNCKSDSCMKKIGLFESAIFKKKKICFRLHEVNHNLYLQ